MSLFVSRKRRARSKRLLNGSASLQRAQPRLLHTRPVRHWIGERKASSITSAPAAGSSRKISEARLADPDQTPSHTRQGPARPSRFSAVKQGRRGVLSAWPAPPPTREGLGRVKCDVLRFCARNTQPNSPTCGDSPRPAVPRGRGSANTANEEARRVLNLAAPGLHRGVRSSANQSTFTCAFAHHSTGSCSERYSSTRRQLFSSVRTAVMPPGT